MRLLFLILITLPIALFGQVTTIDQPTQDTVFASASDIFVNVTFDSQGASVSNGGGDCRNIRLIMGGNTIGSVVSNDLDLDPFSTTFNSTSHPALTSLADGVYETIALTVSSNGTQIRDTVNITIGTGNAAPVVNISSPSNGANFTDPSNVTVEASASDVDGTISQVQFYEDDVLVSTDVSDPYSYTTGSLTLGGYELKAVATDNDGATASDSIQISVGSVDTMFFNTPTEAQSFVIGTDPTVSVNLANLDPLETYNVRMQVDGTGSGTTIQNIPPSTSSITVTWLPSEYDILTGLSIGSHTITIALIEDGAGEILRRTTNISVESIPISGTSSLGRDQDLYIIKGAALDTVGYFAIGKPVDEIVAYKFDGGWVQIPIQIDERKIAPINQPYDNYGQTFGNECNGQTDPELASNWLVEFYADATTFVGADDYELDAIDELVFRYSDFAGDRDATIPANVNQIIAKVGVYDPLEMTTKYVYLFHDTSSPDPSAGIDEVAYEFKFKTSPSDPVWLGKEDFKANYDICNFDDIQNPEDSWISTSEYSIGYSARVVEDSLAIAVNGVKGEDILLRSEASNFNNRSTYHYRRAPGTFTVNKDGCLRAIRGIMGASSGRYLELLWKGSKYYVERETLFRVHGGANSVLYGYVNYDASITNSTYSNSLNVNPLSVDGSSESIIDNQSQTWDHLDSPIGDIITLNDASVERTSVTFNAWYADDVSFQPPSIEEIGAYGAFGIRMSSEDCFDLAYPNNPTCESYNPATIPLLGLFQRAYYSDNITVQADAAKRYDLYSNELEFVYAETTGEGLADEIAITIPSDSTEFSIGDNIDIHVSGNDTDGFESVEIFVDNLSTPLGFVSQERTTTTGNDFNTIFFPTDAPNPDDDLSNVGVGEYKVLVVSSDQLANVLTDTITLFVNPNNSPIVEVEGIRNGDVRSSGSQIPIFVTATDIDGTIDRVELLINESLYITDYSEPYDFVISGLSTGSKLIQVTAYDNEGLFTTKSFTITITDGEGQHTNANRNIAQNVPSMAGKAGFLLSADAEEEDVVWKDPSDFPNGRYSQSNDSTFIQVELEKTNKRLELETNGNSYTINNSNNDRTRTFSTGVDRFDFLLSRSGSERLKVSMSDDDAGRAFTVDSDDSRLKVVGSSVSASSTDSEITIDDNLPTGIKIKPASAVTPNQVLKSIDAVGNVEYSAPLENIEFTLVAVNDSVIRVDATDGIITKLSNPLEIETSPSVGGGSEGDDWGDQSVVSNQSKIPGNGTSSNPLTINDAALVIDYSQIVGFPADLEDGDQFVSSKDVSLFAGEFDFILRDSEGEEMTRLGFKTGTNSLFSIEDGRMRISSINTDSQGLSWNSSNNELSIDGANTVDLSSLITAPADLDGNGFRTSSNNGLESLVYDYRTSTSNATTVSLNNDYSYNLGTRDMYFNMANFNSNITFKSLLAAKPNPFSVGFSDTYMNSNDAFNLRSVKIGTSSGGNFLLAYMESVNLSSASLETLWGIDNQGRLVAKIKNETAQAGQALVYKGTNVNGYDIIGWGDVGADGNPITDTNDFISSAVYNPVTKTVIGQGSGSSGFSVDISSNDTDISEIDFDPNTGELSVAEDGQSYSDVVISKQDNLMSFGSLGGARIRYEDIVDPSESNLIREVNGKLFLAESTQVDDGGMFKASNNTKTWAVNDYTIGTATIARLDADLDYYIEGGSVYNRLRGSNSWEVENVGVSTSGNKQKIGLDASAGQVSIMSGTNNYNDFSFIKTNTLSESNDYAVAMGTDVLVSQPRFIGFSTYNDLILATDNFRNGLTSVGDVLSVTGTDVNGFPIMDLVSPSNSTDNNDFITGASFNPSNGILTATGSGGAGFSVDLDDRYDPSSSNEIQTLDVTALSGNTLQLSLSNDGQTTKQIDLSPVDLNMANDNLSADADRSHDFKGFGLSIDDIGVLEFTSPSTTTGVISSFYANGNGATGNSFNKIAKMTTIGSNGERAEVSTRDGAVQMAVFSTVSNTTPRVLLEDNLVELTPSINTGGGRLYLQNSLTDASMDAVLEEIKDDYSTENEAINDSNLPSGAFFQVTGSNILYRKR